MSDELSVSVVTARLATASNQVPVSDGLNGYVWQASAGGGGIDVQTFTASGSTQIWNKPANAKWVRVLLFQAGGGGGSGRRGAASTLRTGGAGGSGGGYNVREYPASLLSATENVFVGFGGTGAPAVTVDDTNGANGSAGTATYF